jgi:hypothetical protein
MSLFRILDALPNPWNWRFLAATVAVSVVAVISACLRESSDSILAGAAVLILSVLAVVAGRRFVAANSSRAVRLVVAPLLLGIPPLVTAVVMGYPGAGGYPTALVVLMSAALMITRDLEHRATHLSAGREDFPVHTVFHGALAWVSTLFFFFGVAALWPWLGHLYGAAYFWIAVVGVLLPTLYLWGRLRQPRYQPSMVALLRFNRVLPYLGLILLIAILVG